MRGVVGVDTHPLQRFLQLRHVRLRRVRRVPRRSLRRLTCALLLAVVLLDAQQHVLQLQPRALAGRQLVGQPRHVALPTRLFPSPRQLVSE